MLESVKQEKVVGVIIPDNPKPFLQCAKAAQKANGVLGQLTRGVSYRDKECFVSWHFLLERSQMVLKNKFH